MSEASVSDAAQEAPAVHAARIVAALKGEFDPRELARDVNGGERMADFLGALAKDCSDRSTGRGIRWTMKPDARRAVLKNAPLSHLAAVARSMDAGATDPFERAMVRLVLGQPVLISSMKSTDLDGVRKAALFAGGFTADVPELAGEVETMIARKAADESLGFAAPRRLVGRGGAQLRLERFVVGGPDPAAGGRPRALLVTGVGGAGKSALLASFARRTRRSDWSGDPVIWLDFDRALFAEVDQAALLLEFSRQLGLALPALAGSLAAFRGHARDRLLRSQDSREEFDSDAALKSEIWSIWTYALQDHLPLRKRVVLVFDTFEEVLLRSDSEVRELLRFVDALTLEGGVTHVRPIFSGREVQTEVTRDLVERAADHIRLRGLGMEAAERLLKSHLASAKVRPDAFPLGLLVRTFGGNPLIVRLIARFCLEAGPDEVQRALADAHATGLAPRFVHNFLYTRVLKRIRSGDPDVRRLAHPGLALRRVTPDLIYRVLAEPCGIADMDDLRAEELFDELAKQVWLVDRLPERMAIRHRRDLRRLMLAAVSEDDRARMDDIHERAAAYYGALSDPDLPADQQWAEALYHRLLRERPNGQTELDVGAGEAVLFVKALGEDVNDIPVEPRARIKMLAERPLDAVEYSALSGVERNRADLRSARISQRRGEAVEVAPWPTTASSTRLLPDALAFVVQEAFVSGRTDELVTLVDAAWADLLRRFRRESRPVFSTSPAWRIALAGLVDWEIGRAFHHRISEIGSFDWRVARGSPGRRPFGLPDAMACIVVLLDGDLPAWLADLWDEEASKEAASLDELRRWQMQRAAGGTRKGYSLSVNRDLLAMTDSGRSLIIGGRRPASPVPEPTLAEIRGRASRYPESSWATASGGSEPLVAVFPEIYPLIRSNLRHATDYAIVDLADFLGGQSDLWPVELQRPRFESAIRRDRARWLATLVETADRLGLMNELIVAAGHHAHEAGPARLLNGIWSRWQRIMEKVQ